MTLGVFNSTIVDKNFAEVIIFCLEWVVEDVNHGGLGAAAQDSTTEVEKVYTIFILCRTEFVHRFESYSEDLVSDLDGPDMGPTEDTEDFLANFVLRFAREFLANLNGYRPGETHGEEMDKKIRKISLKRAKGTIKRYLVDYTLV